MSRSSQPNAVEEGEEGGVELYENTGKPNADRIYEEVDDDAVELISHEKLGKMLGSSLELLGSSFFFLEGCCTRRAL